MPQLSPTMIDGRVMEWDVEVGDEVAAGDELVEIELDQNCVDLQAHADGFVAKLLLEAESGTIVPVGAPVAVLVENEADVAAFEDYEPPPLRQQPTKPRAPPTPRPLCALTPWDLLAVS